MLQNPAGRVRRRCRQRQRAAARRRRQAAGFGGSAWLASRATTSHVTVRPQNTRAAPRNPPPELGRRQHSVVPLRSEQALHHGHLTATAGLKRAREGRAGWSNWGFSPAPAACLVLWGGVDRLKEHGYLSKQLLRLCLVPAPAAQRTAPPSLPLEQCSSLHQPCATCCVNIL